MLKTAPRRRPTVAKFDSPAQQAYLNLWRTYDRLKAIEEETFARFDLSPQQYNALRILSEAAPATLPTLVVAERLVSRAPDITRLLDRLEIRKLIRRERRAENRRVVQVGLTDDGAALLGAMAADIRRCAKRQLGHLSNRDLRSFVILLKKARAPHEAPPGETS